MKGRRISRRRALAALAAGSGAGLIATLGCSSEQRSARHSAGEVAGEVAREAKGKTAGGVAGDVALLTLYEAAAALRARKLSPVDLARACLDRIGRLDGQLNAFITVTSERALADARRAEAEIARGNWRGPLHGIPIAYKDNIDTAGVLTTAASGVFADRVPAEDAEVVRQLSASGAVLVGKLNMHEFAKGTTSAISYFGPVRNPWALDRIAGGSSGGCGAAVAASLCFGAVGTDTGGSIRIPAACCGIVGLKPTYGVVNAQGTVPVSASFDHVGPMCRTVADTALMFRAMTDHPVAQAFDPDAPPRVSALRVGVVRTAVPVCDGAVEPEVQGAFDAALAVVRRLVTDLVPVRLPMPELDGIIDAESSSFHARWLAEAPERYDPRTRKDATPEKPMPTAEVERLRQALARHRAATHEVFSTVDLVVLPTLPTLPMLLRDATEPFAFPACTFAFSLGGWPAISVPCGFSRSNLPIGLLIGGPALAEPRVLALAQAYEQATDWHRRRPPIG